MSYTVYSVQNVQCPFYPLGYSQDREDARGLTKPGKTSLRVLGSRIEWHLGNSIGFGVLLSHQQILIIEENKFPILKDFYTPNLNQPYCLAHVFGSILSCTEMKTVKTSCVPHLPQSVPIPLSGD